MRSNLGIPRYFSHNVKKQSTDPLRQIFLDNACSPRITAAAGTKLARASSQINVIISISERILQLKYFFQ